MLGVRLYSRGPRRRSGSGILCILGMLAVLASVFCPPAAAAEASSEPEALIASLDELERSINAKIERDLDTIAFAYWRAFDIQRARRLADWIMAPVHIIKTAFDLQLFTEGLSGIQTRIKQAKSTLELTALTAGFVQANAAVSRLMLGGQEIGDALGAMITHASTHPRDAQAFQMTIRYHLEEPAISPIALATPDAPDAQRPVRGILQVRRALAAKLAQLKADLAASPPEPAVIEQAQTSVRDLTRAVKQSAVARQEVRLPASADMTGANALSLGAVMEINRAWTDALGNYDRDMKIEQIVSVISITKLGTSYLTINTSRLDATGAAIRFANRVATALDLGSFAFEYTFTTNAREQVDTLPHEMVLALAPELANLWRLVGALGQTMPLPVATPASTTATAETSETVPGDQVEITRGDGSVLKGQLEDAKIPFVSGYGTIEVETGAITSFADGGLALEDGSVLKGAFGEGEITLTTSQGALRILAREIVAMSRGSTADAAALEALARRFEDWLAGLENRVVAHEAAPSEATLSTLIDHLRQLDAMEKEGRAMEEADAKKIAELMPKRVLESAEALIERSHAAIYAPARAAAQAGDWQTVEIWADRILQLNARDAEARALKDQAVAARAAAATKGLADGLSETEARKLIEDGIAAYTARLSGGGHTQDIYVAESKLWTSGVVYSLTQIDHCWPAQPPAEMPGFDEMACSIMGNCEPLPYAIERGKWIRVNRNGVAPSCTNVNVRGALLGQGGDGAWYAHRVEIVTHTPMLGKIVEILSRGDTARVRYTVNWQETAIYKKWAHDDPELMAQYPAPSGDTHLPLKIPACLRKYDQGWRLEGFGEMFNRC